MHGDKASIKGGAVLEAEDLELHIEGTIEASSVAEMYRRFGIDGFLRLPGSFSVALLVSISRIP